MPGKKKQTKTILIASSAFDEITWEPVADRLRYDGYNVVVYQADRVARGEDTLDIKVSDSGLKIIYNDNTINLATVDAAWYRRTTQFTYDEPNAVRQQTLFREINALQQSLWAEVQNNKWLNAPQYISYAERKITQLKIAKQVGFAVPDTVVSNNWIPIMSKLPRNIIVKSSYGILDAGSSMKAIYTKPFLNIKKSLPLRSNPFPGIWQEQITNKAREWRVTVVGDTVFCAAIYTDTFAKDDWRKHQNTSGVRFEHGELSLAIQEKCRKYLRAFGLRFGAFDFVEDSMGNITFLECNANGQFGWLEDELDLPISRAIADELEKIANGRN